MEISYPRLNPLIRPGLLSHDRVRDMAGLLSGRRSSGRCLASARRPEMPRVETLALGLLVLYDDQGVKPD